MTDVWDLDLPPSEKIVLLALADQANDAGRNCWPSVPTIARRSSQGERTVRRALQSLEAKGLLSIHHRTGTSSQYHIHLSHPDTPANLAGVCDGSPPPATVAPPPCQSGSPPPATVAGKPSIESSSETPIESSKGVAAKTELPDWIPLDAWNGFLEMRKASGKKPTARAVELLIAKLDRLRADGNDPGEVLDQSTERNWQGLFEVKGNGRDANNRTGGGYGNRQSGWLG